ncbi:MAG TPA: ABC transporter permease [Gemmatimonadales bacterium]|jgi:predicted permease
MLPEGVRRFFRLGRARDVEAELEAELAFHFEKKIEALTALGMTPEAAREEAIRQFGDLRAARAELLRVDRGTAQKRQLKDRLEDWVLDIRFAVRSLLRTPGLTVTVVILLGLGLGANAAMLGILDRLLLRPPPFLADPGHLLRVGVVDQVYAEGSYLRVQGSYLDIADYQRGVPEFSAVAGYMSSSPVKFGSDSLGTVEESVVSPQYFRTLGAAPLLGRTFDTTDAAGPAVAVVGNAMWRTHLGGTASALGREIYVDGHQFTVIGVMPAGFSGVQVGAADVWLMASQAGLPLDWTNERRTMAFGIIARLRAGTDPSVAAARVTAVRAAIEVPKPRQSEVVKLVSIIPGRWMMEQRGMRLSVVVAAVGLLLLLITVANVAHVLLVRAMARQREFALRTALGAGWGRLLRLVLSESIVVALAGGVIAALVAPLAAQAFRALLWPDTSWASPPISLFTGVCAAVLALLIGIITGIVPAMLARREDAVAALRTGMQRGRGWRGGVRLPLVAFQVAVSAVLIGGAGLFALSLARVGTADHGLDLRHLIDAPIALDSGAAWREQLDAVETEVGRVPGVVAVTAAWSAPYRGFSFEMVRPAVGDSAFGTMSVVADAGFFRASGLRITQGREFTRDDASGAAPVTIVNDVLAARFWRGRSPIGACLYRADVPGCVRVVGVAAQARLIQLKDEMDAQMYLPLDQVEQLTNRRRGVELYVRTIGDPDVVVDPVRRTLARVLPSARTVRVRSFNDLMSGDIRPWRVGVLLFGIAAALAALLSAVGLYAVMAFDVRQRYHELGVRRALGAPGSHILRLVVTRGLAMVGLGVVLGVGGLLAAGRSLAPLLFQTSARDPLALIGPALILLVVAAAASLWPARAAMRVNPREALQAD